MSVDKRIQRVYVCVAGKNLYCMKRTWFMGESVPLIGESPTIDLRLGSLSVKLPGCDKLPGISNARRSVRLITRGDIPLLMATPALFRNLSADKQSRENIVHKQHHDVGRMCKSIQLKSKQQ